MTIRFRCTFCTLLLFMCFSAFISGAQIITTVAGNGIAGYTPDGGAATAASLNLYTATATVLTEAAIAFDAAGNMYFTETENSLVRMVNTAGIITTIAGQHGVFSYNGDGIPASNAALNDPTGIAVDAAGNIYICDYYNARVRMVNTSGIISTIAGTGTAGGTGNGGPATNAQVACPAGIVIDGSGNIFISDRCNMNVRKINTSGIISLVAGTGITGYNGDNIPATTANLSKPRGMAFDGAGNLYICEAAGSRIRKVDKTGTITTVAGIGSTGPLGADTVAATTATVANPDGIVFDFEGNYYIACSYDSRVRKVNPSGIITTVAGTGVSGWNGDGGIAKLSQLSNPESVAIYAGSLFIADAYNNRVRKVGLPIAGVKNITGQLPGIDVAPNPNNGLFTFSVVSDIGEQVQVIITNIVGEKVKEVTTQTNRQTNINMGVSRGIYFISAATHSGRYTAKVVVR